MERPDACGWPIARCSHWRRSSFASRVIAGVLAVIAGHFGALPLLVATAGILAARTAVLRLGVQP